MPLSPRGRHKDAEAPQEVPASSKDEVRGASKEGASTSLGMPDASDPLTPLGTSHALTDASVGGRSDISCSEAVKKEVSIHSCQSSSPSVKQLRDKQEVLTLRGRGRRIVLSLEFQLFMICVILFDVAAFVVDEVHAEAGSGEDSDLEWPTYVSMACVSLYTVEIVVKLVLFHCHGFFKDMWNVFDLIIVVASALLFEGLVVARLSKLILRIVSGTLKLFRLCLRAKPIAQAARQKVSKNKTRYIDAKNNLNLDLTYVLDRLIAMGVPATGFVDKIFRNPLSDVARFFKLNHRDHFRVYNLCPEMPYAERLVKKYGGTVRCFDIQDHSPPLMDHFVQFLADAGDFYMEDTRNVLAVHCKAGKGRTGCFCCAWLLYAQYAKTADEAMALFAERRTNVGLGKKLRGVETPSQIRYVRQLSEHLRRSDSSLSSCSAPPRIAAPEVRLSKLSFEGGFFAHPASIAGVRVLVHCFDGRPGPPQTALETDAYDASAEGVPLQDVRVRGDVRVALFEVPKAGSGRQRSAEDAALACKYFDKADGLLAYFWLHTGFLHPEQGQEQGAADSPPKPPPELCLSVSQVDRANKRVHTAKRKGRFGEGSRLVLRFASAGGSGSGEPEREPVEKVLSL